MSIHEVRNFMKCCIINQLTKFIIPDLTNIVGNYIACKHPTNPYNKCNHKNIFCGLNQSKRVKINGNFNVTRTEYVMNKTIYYEKTFDYFHNYQFLYHNYYWLNLYSKFKNIDIKKTKLYKKILGCLECIHNYKNDDKTLVSRHKKNHDCWRIRYHYKCKDINNIELV
jgi:hypothetical protein